MSLTLIVWIAGTTGFSIIGIWLTSAVSRWTKNLETLLELKGDDVPPWEVKVELEPLLSPLEGRTPDLPIAPIKSRT
jgi:hypothetical protein